MAYYEPSHLDLQCLQNHVFFCLALYKLRSFLCKRHYENLHLSIQCWDLTVLIFHRSSLGGVISSPNVESDACNVGKNF